MLPQWIIEKKRDGNELSEEEIRSFIEGYNSGAIPDYQMSAMAMAIYFEGMSFEETTVLTDAMMNSGAILDTSSIAIPKADKHSTGGIGDKVSLLLAPLAACCGIAVPMISGRGLGITGGTLDKLESIPGYRTDLSEKEWLDVLNKCGCSIIGQTAEIAPADKKLYALRDVTGTVPSIPLISASIMSKKMAEGIDALVLDVKCGSGAFMKSKKDALLLGRNMVEIGRGMGKSVNAVITAMDQPLGRAVGNSLEVAETVLALQGQGPDDLIEETIELTAHMLLLTKQYDSISDAKAILNDKIDSGAAYEKFIEMVTLHGGDPDTISNSSRLPQATIKRDFTSKESGYIEKVDAEMIGRASLLLGGGRAKTDENVDHAVGISNLLKVGEKVERSQRIAVIHANDETRLDKAMPLIEKAFSFTEKEISEDLILETIS